MDEAVYLKKQEEEQVRYESLCRRCGACCGAHDDPCEHLRKDDSGKYFCPIYDHRIGMHKTLSGKMFACVPIRDLRPNLPFKHCVYYLEK